MLRRGVRTATVRSRRRPRRAANVVAGLVASGWHTAGITMRLIVGGGLPIAGGIIGTGGESLWTNPGTKPRDTLQVECEVLEIMPSRSKPDRGTVVVRCLTKAQTGEEGAELHTEMVVPRRLGSDKYFARGRYGMPARNLPEKMEDRFIVALDVPTIEKASNLACTPRRYRVVLQDRTVAAVRTGRGASILDGLIVKRGENLPRCQDLRHRRDRATGRRPRRRAGREPRHRAWRSGDHARRGGRQGA